MCIFLTEFLLATDVSKLDDLDELEVYGAETNTSTELVSYSFEVCSTICVHFHCFMIRETI